MLVVFFYFQFFSLPVIFCYNFIWQTELANHQPTKATSVHYAKNMWYFCLFPSTHFPFPAFSISAYRVYRFLISMNSCSLWFSIDTAVCCIYIQLLGRNSRMLSAAAADATDVEDFQDVPPSLRRRLTCHPMLRLRRPRAASLHPMLPRSFR